jgi:hypothetical protein
MSMQQQQAIQAVDRELLSALLDMVRELSSKQGVYRAAWLVAGTRTGHAASSSS